MNTKYIILLLYVRMFRLTWRSNQKAYFSYIKSTTCSLFVVFFIIVFIYILNMSKVLLSKLKRAKPFVNLYN